MLLLSFFATVIMSLIVESKTVQIIVKLCKMVLFLIIKKILKLLKSKKSAHFLLCEFHRGI